MPRQQTSIYAESAKRIIVLAMEEVERYGHHSIRFEHLLLAILRENRSETEQVFAEKKINSEQLEKKLKKSIRDGRKVYKGRVEIPFSKVAVSVLNTELHSEPKRVTAAGLLQRILENPSKGLKRTLLKCHKDDL